jgi:hypothetical protein
VISGRKPGIKLKLSGGILSYPPMPSALLLRRPFEKFVDWRQCAAVMQREAVTLMPSCSGGGNVVVA